MPRSEDGGGEEAPPPKQGKKELREALRTVQAQNLELREQVERLTQGQAAAAAPAPAENAGQAKAHTSSDAELARHKSIAASTGRRAAVLHMPFMEDDYLFDHRVHEVMDRLLAEVIKASLDPADPEADKGEELADESNPKKFWDSWRFDVPDAVDMAREIIYRMPPGAGEWWFKGYFKSSFLDGYRKIRGNVVFYIAKNHDNILGIVDKRFVDKKIRVTMPEVEELRDTFQYQEYPPEDKALAGKPNPHTVFWHDCIMKTIRYIYSGESAISTGARSKKARNSHSELWHMKEVQPPAIAFAVTAIDYVLSGEPSFEKATVKSKYQSFFNGRLGLLQWLHQDHYQIFCDLINRLNRLVLPSEYPADEEREEGLDPPAEGFSERDVKFMENW
ncbi:hypothetical protein FRC08_007002 [Ceratobasidium sp. 394]|nr:hypothetical protein FRC08_007002 [Ceratobasidium sp. 394]